MGTVFERNSLHTPLEQLLTYMAYIIVDITSTEFQRLARIGGSPGACRRRLATARDLPRMPEKAWPSGGGFAARQALEPGVTSLGESIG